MLTLRRKFMDFNNEEREEDFQFGLMESEVAEMNLSVDGGLSDYVQKIIQTKKTPELAKVFKDLILKSYGVKSADGRRFIKNDQLREEFSQTRAFSDLYMELATNDEFASMFINGIAPEGSITSVGTPVKVKNKAE